MFRTTDAYANTMRVQNVYRERLRAVGLERLVPITYGLYDRAVELPGTGGLQRPGVDVASACPGAI